MTSFDWNEEQVADLTRMLVDEHMSRSMVASELSEKYGCRLTRNAVIGKAGRLGILNGNRPAYNDPGIKIRRHANGRTPKRATVIKSHEEIGPVAVELRPDKSEFAVPFMKRKDEQCPWPLWADDVPLEQRKVCGADRRKLNYCPRHFRLSINPKLRRV